MAAGRGPKVHAREDGQPLGALILSNQPQPSFIPAGACPSNKGVQVAWHLRGAGEREGSGQPWLLSRVLLVDLSCRACLPVWPGRCPPHASPPAYLSHPVRVPHQLTGGRTEESVVSLVNKQVESLLSSQGQALALREFLGRDIMNVWPGRCGRMT